MRILIIALLFASCSKMNVQKETALPDEIKIAKDFKTEQQRGATWWWYTGYGEAGITGIRYGVGMTITVPNYGGGAELKATWLEGYFNRYRDVNGVEYAYWCQWGIAKHSKYGLIPIFVFYNLFTGEIDPHAVLITGGISQAVGDIINYRFYFEDGRLLFSRNGIVIWAVTMPPQVTHFQRVGVMTEKMDDRAGGFPKVVFHRALDIKDVNGWKMADSLRVLQCNWGIEGMLQNSNLRFGEVNIGGSISKLPFGTKLY
jgi:hypothetical protein